MQNVSIYVNNQVASSNNECNLDLKPNDVIKIIGSYQPNQVIEITAFNQTFKQQTNENGDLLLLFSIPFVDYGSYKIETKLEKDENLILLCNVKISKETKNEDNIKTSKNNSKYYLLLLLILPISIVLLFIKKNNKIK